MEEKKNGRPGNQPAKGPDPDQEIDEALRKFQLQTGLGAGSPILPFIRLAMKASAPAPRPNRDQRGPVLPPPGIRPSQPDMESYKPIEPSSSAWVLVMIAAALAGLLFAWLARTGALN
jgi:hypothetical protein